MKTKYTGIAVLLLLTIYLTACVMEGQLPLPTHNDGIGNIEPNEDGLKIKASLSSYEGTITPQGTTIYGFVIPAELPDEPAMEDLLQEVGSINDGSFKISLPDGGIGLFFVGDAENEEVEPALLVLATITETEQAFYIIMQDSEGTWGFLEVDEEGLSPENFFPDEDEEDPVLNIKPLKDLPSTARWYCVPFGQDEVEE
ncbi:MAG: hypothetical protein LBD20_05360 [Spirochaetaceae bacterium]|jgi:nitrogen regulatory protein PII-like uncharacterized protein|nr:hypothetical protein [Spirochaetaceae bacterium]